MAVAAFPVLRTFEVGRATANANTAFTAFIPPYVGPVGVAPTIFKYVSGGVSRGLLQSGGVIHVTNIWYTTGATIHDVTIMRPLNFTTLGAALAISTTNITLTADPGVFSTNYNYPLPSGQTAPCLADDAITTGDYVAIQCDDGTWFYDTIASGSFGGGNLVLTTGTSSKQTAAKGNLVYFFGVAADVSPVTGVAHWNTDIPASANRQNIIDNIAGELAGLNRGDPMIFYSPNGTNQGYLEGIAGYYSDR